MDEHRELRIGVTGHRWTDEPPRLRQRVRSVLDRLMSLSRHGAGLTVLSPLAEGADRLVVDEALEIGAAIECPLPLRRADYERDFQSIESLAEFRRLLRQASRVKELGGDGSTPEGRNAAYAAAGTTIVAQCDVLLAIWDGEPSRGEGGTAQVVVEALDAGRPVLWVHAHPPHDHQVLTEAASQQHRGTLATELELALREAD